MSGCHDGHGASASQNDELSVLQRLTAVHHPGAEAIRESVSLPGQYLSDHDRARSQRDLHAVTEMLISHAAVHPAPRTARDR